MQQILIAIDQLLNTLLGGMADETLSARAWREQSAWVAVIDMLFFWQDNHCLRSYEAEMQRKQMPKEYR